MRIALWLVLLSLGLATPQTGSAQRPGPSILWQRPTILATSPTPATLVASYGARAPDHRWEGMAIGAGAGAIAFGLLGAVICSHTDNDCAGILLRAGLLGAFCGGITGGLIGGAIPKGELSDSTGGSS